MMNKAMRWQTGLIVAGLALLATMPYWQLRGADFLSFDDRYYIWDNPIVKEGLTRRGILWAFTTLTLSNWHPLAWLSHMLDVQVWGLWPGGHHLTNVLFHAANTSLLFWLLRVMTGATWRSALVAALFAVHPLHVESVAWVSERKDVLSTFFGLLAILAYTGYVRQRSVSRYLLIIGLFTLSLLSKPMLVTLPFLLLLLDVWPLKRVDLAMLGSESKAIGRLILEKLPLLAMSAASSVITVIAQKASGSVYSLEALPLWDRFDNAVVSYVLYIVKMLWPVKLAVLYPLPDHWPIWQVIASAVILIVITTLTIMFRRRFPYLLIGWLWFVGLLIPVIGLLQVGLQSMADRYTYVPMIGLFIMIAWSLPFMAADAGAPARRAGSPGSKIGVAALTTAAVVTLTVLTWQSWVQAAYWHDSITLFTRTLAITNNNIVAHMHMGFALEQAGRYEEAVAHYTKVLGLRVKYRAAHFNLANTLVLLGRIEEAIPHYRTAIELTPEASSAAAHHNLGVAYFRLSRMPEAEAEYRKAIELKPDYAEAHFNLGLVLVNQRKPELAIEQYEQALNIVSDYFDARVQLGVALAAVGRVDDAIAEFERALRLKPDDPQAREMLQLARQQRDAAATTPRQ